MAWENANVGLDGQSTCNLTSAWESSNTTVENDWTVTASSERRIFRDGISGVDLRGKFSTNTPDGTHILFGDLQYGLVAEKNGNIIYFRCYNNGTRYSYPAWGPYDLAWGDVPPPSFYIFVGINEATQKGTIAIFHSYYSDPNRYRYYALYSGLGGNAEYFNSSFLYQVIKQHIIPQYNWQSVPSISGKNGILTLSTLNDVNDGEPVETSDTSKFNLTDDSNVSALVAAHFSQ